jgi:hypothetical protein
MKVKKKDLKNYVNSKRFNYVIEMEKNIKELL